MNKQELVTTLQACLFAFDDLNEKEIMELNPDYNLKCVKIGIHLWKYFQSIKINEELE